MKDYGTDLAASRGTSVTPGTNVFGAWAELVASTAREHSYWTCGMDQLTDTTLVGMNYLVELGFGAAAAERVFAQFRTNVSSDEMVLSLVPPLIYFPIPSGTRIAARMASADVEARGLIAYGMD